MKKSMLSLILCLMLLACAPFARASGNAGTDMPDFTVKTDSGLLSLEGMLSEKKAVLINFWASWCGYCIQEFPLFQAAYEKYGDEVGFVALTVEEKDGDAEIDSLRKETGVTFPMGRDTIGLGNAYVRGAIPVTIVVDRFGKIVFEQTGAFARVSDIINLLAVLTSDSYTESRVFSQPPSAPVTAEAETQEALSAALNAEGSTLVFENVEDGETWPMAVFSEDGRSGVRSTNGGMDYTVSAVKTVFTSSEGEAFCVSVRSSSLGGMDTGRLIVDGVPVKVFSGERGWRQFIWPLDAGEHEVRLTYRKLGYGSAGEDCVWYAGACLVTAEKTEENADAEPSGLRIISPGTRRVVPETAGLFQDGMDVYLTESDRLTAELTLGPGVDEEAVVISAANRYLSTDSLQTADHRHFTFEIPVTDAMKNEGMSFIVFYPSTEEPYVRAAACIFTGEALQGIMGAEAYELEEAEVSSVATGKAVYAFRFVDRQGRGVPDVRVNLCTDTYCTTLTSDENGEASAELESDIYHVQVTRIPEGYSFDMNTERDAGFSGCSMEFVLSEPAS